MGHDLPDNDGHKRIPAARSISGLTLADAQDQQCQRSLEHLHTAEITARETFLYVVKADPADGRQRPRTRNEGTGLSLGPVDAHRHSRFALERGHDLASNPFIERKEVHISLPPDATPEEAELLWQVQHPEGEIIHVEADEEGNIESIDEDPYGADDDDDDE